MLDLTHPVVRNHPFLPSDPDTLAALADTFQPGRMLLITGGMSIDLATAIGSGLAPGAVVPAGGASGKERVRGAIAQSAVRPDQRILEVGGMLSAAEAAAVAAALAEGYCVVTIVHAPSAVAALCRIPDIAEDAGTAEAILAATTATLSVESMLRHPCPACRRPWGAGSPLGPSWACGPGCPDCAHSGNIGHVCVTEVLLVDDAVRAAAADPERAAAIERLMRPVSGHDRMAGAAARATTGLRFWSREQDLRRRLAAGEADGQEAERAVTGWLA